MKIANKAFTLTELLLAFAILAFALTGILALFTSGMFLNEANQNLSLAASHAQYVLEDIRNTSFSSIKTDINSGNWNWNAATISGKGMTSMASESIATAVSGTEPLDVTVTVSWQDRNSRSRAEYFETLISDSG